MSPQGPALPNNLLDSAPPVANIDARNWDFDGFHVDEFHATDRDPETRVYLSRFNAPLPSDQATRLAWKQSTTTIGPTTKRVKFKNPLEDSAVIDPVEVVKEGNTQNPEAGIDWWYWAYAPPAVRANPPQRVKLSLFFGPPGPVMNRQGLRSYFERSDHILITIPGTEDQPKFGVGMNRTVNALLTPSLLASVQRMIYYDCLYPHSVPKTIDPTLQGSKPKPGEHTFHAMEKVISNSAAAKIVIYEISGNTTDREADISGGTPRKTSRAYWTRWPKDADPLQASNKRTIVYNLRRDTNVTNQLVSLGLARLFQTALTHRYFNADFVKTQFGKRGQLLVDVIKSKLQKRGSYASSEELAKRHGKTWIEKWLPGAEANQLSALSQEKMIIPPAKAGQPPTGFLNDARFDVVGWRPISSTLDLSHDTHVPEFAWEHLLGG